MRRKRREGPLSGVLYVLTIANALKCSLTTIAPVDSGSVRIQLSKKH